MEQNGSKINGIMIGGHTKSYLEAEVSVIIAKTALELTAKKHQALQ